MTVNFGEPEVVVYYRSREGSKFNFPNPRFFAVFKARKESMPDRVYTKCAPARKSPVSVESPTII